VAADEGGDRVDDRSGEAPRPDDSPAVILSCI
jgi:hypothetical protein